MLRYIFSISLLLFFCQCSYGQDAQISSDRLNISPSTSLVKKGSYQIESGYLLTKTNESFYNIYYAQLPSIQQRYGLSNRVELRLSIVSAASFARNTSSLFNNYYLDGVEGPQLGAKIKLFKQKKLVPHISVLTAIKLPPIVARLYESKNVRPSLQILMSHNLPAQITLGYNLGSTWDKKLFYSYDVCLQKKWGPKFITNINYADEWFAPDETGPNKQKNIRTCIGYYFTDKIIADIGLGWGIENAPDKAYKVGVSFALR